MRKLALIGAAMLALAATSSSVEARPGGCLKYGLGGAVAGHLQAGTAGKVLPWAVWWASFSGDGTTLVPDTTTGAGRWVSVVTMIVAHPMAGTAGCDRKHRRL